MIADCAATVSRWEAEGREVEDGDEYFIRLSRGEYDEQLYTECVAEDCEVDGDWDGAKEAYNKVLAHADDNFTARKALVALAHIHALLNEDRPALAYYRRASRLLRRDESRIFYRSCLVAEGRQLMSMGRVWATQRCVRRGFATFESGHEDYLNYANLLTLRAACELARRRAAAAEFSLREAWQALEQLSEIRRNIGLEDEGSGVHAAYATWWKTEGVRRSLVGDMAGEVEAAQHAVDRMRRGAKGWDNLAWNAGVMRALQRLADAYERNNQRNDAAQSRSEAEELRVRWHLPSRPASGL